MVATLQHSLLPIPSAAQPRSQIPYSSPVGYAKAAARRLSHALPPQWSFAFEKDILSSHLSDVDLSRKSELPRWVGHEKAQEPLPTQLCPGGFPDFEGDVRFDPLETTPSLLPSHSKYRCRPSSSSSSLSDLSDSSCSAADVLSLLPGSLLLDLHTCRDASKVVCASPHFELKPEQPDADEETTSTVRGRPRRKSAPRRFLDTNLERSPRQLSFFSWTAASFDLGPATPVLQAPGWKQVDYIGTPCAPTPLEGQQTAPTAADAEVESDDEAACFTTAQMERMFEPFDRRPSNVAALETLRPAGGVGLEGRARAMSAL